MKTLKKALMALVHMFIVMKMRFMMTARTLFPWTNNEIYKLEVFTGREWAVTEIVVNRSNLRGSYLKQFRAAYCRYQRLVTELHFLQRHMYSLNHYRSRKGNESIEVAYHYHSELTYGRLVEKIGMDNLHGWQDLILESMGVALNMMDSLLYGDDADVMFAQPATT